MRDGQPKPEEPKAVEPVDPNEVAQAAALENPTVTDQGSTPPTEIQVDVVQPESDRPSDDSSVADSETEARIQELRRRGRVGVLSEGTERPDSSRRMKNSEHDKEAIAVANKANRQWQQQLTTQNVNRAGPKVGEIFKSTRDSKLNEVSGRYSGRSDPNLRQYFEDPEGWEANTRQAHESFGTSEDDIESAIGASKSRLEGGLEDIGEKWDTQRDQTLKERYEYLEAHGRSQDKYRGNILDLYAREPDKYKDMSAEEFVAQGKEFISDSWDVSRTAALESWGSRLMEELPTLVEDVSSVSEFCAEMNKRFAALRWDLQKKGIDQEELLDFAEAIEGKEAPPLDLPKDKADWPAFQKKVDDREDTEERLRLAGMHGYFTGADFTKDLDRAPREQMKEAIDRAKAVTDRWIEAGQKARTEFEEKWGEAPESEKPESQDE